MFPNAYIEYLVHFHGTRDYFECHEVLEEHWKRHDPLNRSSVWVFLIQLSVSLYHHRRGNFKGAEKLMKRCLHSFPQQSKSLTQLGLDEKRLKQLLDQQSQQINHHQPYKSIVLPIQNNQLKNLVLKKCDSWNVPFGHPSPMVDSLIEKHRLRKR